MPSNAFCRRRLRLASLAVAAVFCGSPVTVGAADTFQERVQLCGTCHGENGNSRMENTPSLAGQPELFLTNQMILMRERVRRSEVMEPFVKGLKDDEIVALAAHYAKLKPEPSEGMSLVYMRTTPVARAWDRQAPSGSFKQIAAAIANVRGIARDRAAAPDSGDAFVGEDAVVETAAVRLVIRQRCDRTPRWD